MLRLCLILYDYVLLRTPVLFRRSFLYFVSVVKVQSYLHLSLCILAYDIVLPYILYITLI